MGKRESMSPGGGDGAGTVSDGFAAGRRKSACWRRSSVGVSFLIDSFGGGFGAVRRMFESIRGFS